MFRNHPVFSKYKADRNGNIVGARGHQLKRIQHHTGYNVLTVNYKQYRWHRFVWECWNGVIEDDLTINHLDGDKTNNDLSNMELVTIGENIRHAHLTGLSSGNKGEDAGSAKLNNSQARELIILCREGVLSNTELGFMFNLHSRYISLIRHKRRWKHLWSEIDKEFAT